MPQLGCGILWARARLLQLCPTTALARNMHGCHSSGPQYPRMPQLWPQYPRANGMPQLGCGILRARARLPQLWPAISTDATALALNIPEPTGATALTTPSLHISLYSTVYISRVYTVAYTMQYIYSILVHILQYVLWLQRHVPLRFISLI
jgi:hypothetical protein